ncbi:hypothetical protein [Infirmifilum uzonense]|uniref:hypothetical protein n=1 Tax=Infirmifilum uzonense TaxID=1550241 RepID=UPI003C793EE2
MQRPLSSNHTSLGFLRLLHPVKEIPLRGDSGVLRAMYIYLMITHPLPSMHTCSSISFSRVWSFTPFPTLYV